jgi:uncharacterized protein YjbI with pentapeptide repeats
MNKVFEKAISKNNNIYNNTTFNKVDLSNNSFFHKSYKRNFFNEVVIEKKDISFCAFTSSNFNHCSLIVNKIMNVNMQLCHFNNIDFSNVNTFYSTTFDNSFFEKCTFSNTIFKSCNFTNAMFINCYFDSVIFKSSNYDNCTFLNCKFINFEFTYMNIDYSKFLNCSIENSILSGMQLPYIFGFNNLLENDSNKILINNQYFLLNEYKESFNLLLDRFKKTNEYFPIINITYMINLEYCECEAYEACKVLCYSKNFIMLKRIIELCNFLKVLQYNKRNEIISLITSLSNEIDNHYISLCKKLLINDASNDSITIETGLDYNDPKFLALVKKIDEEITKREENGFHVIRYNHKSPVILDISLLSTFGSIASIIGLTPLIVNAIKKFFKRKNEPKLQNFIKITTTYVDDNGNTIIVIEKIYY